jgi:hypothetical protein
LVNPAPPPPTILGSLQHKNAEVVVAEELNTKLSNKTTLFERSFALYPSLSSGDNFRSQFDISASTKLKNWLGWQITYSDRYITNPPVGLKGNDQLLSTGVRLTFGHQ